MNDQILVNALDSRSHQLILFPTEQCNFRCTYCYEDFKIGRMQAPVIQGIERYINNRIANLSHLTISWFGGEPLLALPVMRRIGSHAHRLCRMHEVEYVGSVTTNGYLLCDATLHELAALGILEYQITLDGPEETHNKTRRRADGKGTFETIWRNLESMTRSSLALRIILRIHYSEVNYRRIPILLTELRALVGDDERFILHLKSVENLGGPTASNIPKWAPGRRQDIHRELSALLPSKKVTRIGDYICYAARPNSIAIRADGGLAKCTVDLNDEKNDVGWIDEYGKLHWNYSKLSYWFRGYSGMSADELTCPAHTKYLPQKRIPIYPQQEGQAPEANTSKLNIVSRGETNGGVNHGD